MQIKLFVSAAAIALVAGLASASAADQFTTLDGVTAAAMSPGELGTVVGSAKHANITDPAVNRTIVTAFVAAGFTDSDGTGVSFQGGHLQRAEDAGSVIDVCGYSAGC